MKESFIVRIDEQEFAFSSGYVFRGLTVSGQPRQRNVIIRATAPNGQAVYAMGTGESVNEVFDSLWSALCMGGGEQLWHLDRYAR